MEDFASERAYDFDKELLGIQDFEGFGSASNMSYDPFLLPCDAYGLAVLAWPGIHPQFREEIKKTSSLFAASGVDFKWLEGIPVFKSWKQYTQLWKFTWARWVARGDRLIELSADNRSSSNGSQSNGSQSVSLPAPRDAASKGVCKHFKKFGSCKFGDEECRNGLHPARFRRDPKAPVIPAPLSTAPAVLPAGAPPPVVIEEKNKEVRDCRRCSKSFTECSEYWLKTLKMAAMPWHCVDCRLLNREEKKAQKAVEAAALVAGAAVASEHVPASEKDGGSDFGPWDEVLTWDAEVADRYSISLVIGSTLSDSGDATSNASAAWNAMNKHGLAVTSTSAK